MKQFGKILKFELKYFFKNKIFVGITIFLVLLIAIVMFFPRIMELTGGEKSSEAAADLPIMIVKADDPSQADMVKEIFAASFTDYSVQIANEDVDTIKEKITIIIQASIFFKKDIFIKIHLYNIYAITKRK